MFEVDRRSAFDAVRLLLISFCDRSRRRGAEYKSFLCPAKSFLLIDFSNLHSLVLGKYVLLTDLLFVLFIDCVAYFCFIQIFIFGWTIYHFYITDHPIKLAYRQHVGSYSFDPPCFGWYQRSSFCFGDETCGHTYAWSHACSFFTRAIPGQCSNRRQPSKQEQKQRQRGSEWQCRSERQRCRRYYPACQCPPNRVIL